MIKSTDISYSNYISNVQNQMNPDTLMDELSGRQHDLFYTLVHLNLNTKTRTQLAGVKYHFFSA